MAFWVVMAALSLQDSPEKVSLRQAIGQSLRNSSEIEVGRFDPWIEEQTLLAQYGQFDHVIFSNWRTTHSEIPGTTFFAGAPEVETITHDFTLGVRRRYQSGIQAQLDFNARSNQSNSQFALLNPNWQDTLGLTLTIPILRDSGTDANTALIVLQKQRLASSIDTFEVNLTDSIHAVARAYYELVFAIENRRIAQRSLELSKRLVQENERKLAQGVIPKVQLTEAQAQVAQREQTLLRAEQTLWNASDRLRRLIDPSTLRSSEQTYLPTDVPEAPKDAIDEKALLQSSLLVALDRRADLRRAQRAIESADVALRKAEKDALPKFDLIGRAAMLGNDDTIEKSFNRMFQFDNHEVWGGFQFEVPIENRALYHAMLRSELEARRARIARRDVETRIILEVREAVRDVKTQQRTLASADEQVRLAQERYDAETARFQQGLTTTYFLLVSQNDLDSALLNQLRARIDAALSQIALRRATGTLLSDYGVSVPQELSPR